MGRIADRMIQENMRKMLWFVRARAVHNLKQQGHIATGKLSDIDIAVQKVSGEWEGSLKTEDYGIKINDGNFLTGDYSTMYRWAKVKEPTLPEHFLVKLARATTNKRAYMSGSNVFSKTGKRTGWLDLAIGSDAEIERSLNINGIVDELISEFCKNN